MNAIDRFDETARHCGGAPAVVWRAWHRRRSTTFAELAERSRRLATLFARSGLERGDAVVVLLPFGAPFLAVTGALMRSGLTAVFVDPVQWRATLGVALAGFRVRGMVGTMKACALRRFEPRLRSVPHTFVDGRFPGARSLHDAAKVQPAVAPADCDPDDAAVVTFTSGTTGVPKAVVRTHGTLAAMQRMLEREIEGAAGEVHLSTLPFAALAVLAAGATCVIPDLRGRRVDARRVAARIRSEGIEVLITSPGFAERLAAADGDVLASLRRIYVGGAPVFPRVLDALACRAPRARITIVYGMTEAEPIATLAARDYAGAERMATRAGAGLLVGRPVQEADVRIAASSPGAGFAARGEEGEICVSGPHVSTAIRRGTSDRDAICVAEGRRWLRTGDAGHLDARGRLWLTGRCRDAVPLAGTTIHPLRVEASLAEDPAVARAAFLAFDGRRTVVVQPRDAHRPIDPDRVATATAFALPEAIAVVDRIPLDRRHNAKVDYRALAAALKAGTLRARRTIKPGHPSPTHASAWVAESDGPFAPAGTRKYDEGAMSRDDTTS